MDEQRNEIRRLHNVCSEYREEKQTGVKLLVEKFSGKLTLQEIKEIVQGFSADEYLKDEVINFLTN